MVPSDWQLSQQAEPASDDRAAQAPLGEPGFPKSVETLAHRSQQRPPWEIYKPSAHPDVPVDELYLYPRIPAVHADNPESALPTSALGDFPLTNTAPPEFLDKEHLKAMQGDASHPHACSNAVEPHGSNHATKAQSVSGSSHDLEDSILLDPKSKVCPQGRDGCTCLPEAIELFKNAATYLYKHTRTLSQEFFQAHVHVGERIERLHQMNALNGGPILPSSIHEFLQTETSQLLQDWAIAESKCSRYMCDCILADVNSHVAEEPSEGAAKGIPPDVVELDSSFIGSEEPGEMPREVSEGSTTSQMQAQCSERFADLKKDLLSLTERSEKVKRHWANLLDLCNKLDEVAQIQFAVLDGWEDTAGQLDQMRVPAAAEHPDSTLEGIPPIPEEE